MALTGQIPTPSLPPLDLPNQHLYNRPLPLLEQNFFHHYFCYTSNVIYIVFSLTAKQLLLIYILVLKLKHNFFAFKHISYSHKKNRQSRGRQDLCFHVIEIQSLKIHSMLTRIAWAAKYCLVGNAAYALYLSFRYQWTLNRIRHVQHGRANISGRECT